MSAQESAKAVMTEFLDEIGKLPDALTDDLSLYGSGLEMDSLEAAELSALLEDELGKDPFATGGDLPQTVGEVLAFYA